MLSQEGGLAPLIGNRQLEIGNGMAPAIVKPGCVAKLGAHPWFVPVPLKHTSTPGSVRSSDPHEVPPQEDFHGK